MTAALPDASPNASPDARHSISSVPFLAVTVAMWGGSFIAARFVAGATEAASGPSGQQTGPAAGGFDPFAVLGGRVLLAGLAFLPLLAARRIRPIALRDVPLLLVVATTGQWGYLLLFHLGARGSTAATASLIINLSPVIGTIAGIVWLHEHTSRWRMIGVGLAIAGTIPVSLGDGGGLHLSASVLWLLAAAAAAGIYLVAGKPLVDKYGGLSVTAWGAWASLPFGLPFAPRAIDQLHHADRSAVVALLYLGLGSSAIAYVTWGMGLARTSASTASAWLFAAPVLAVVGAWVLLGEQPGVLTIGGGLVALVGVWMATTPPPNDECVRSA